MRPNACMVLAKVNNVMLTTNNNDLASAKGLEGQIEPGMQVLVSDGEPMPPARFKRKLEAWKNRNYVAVVLGEADRGGYRLQFSVGHTILYGAMVFLRDVGPGVSVTPIEGAPRAPLTDAEQFMEPVVDWKSWALAQPKLREAAKASHIADLPTAILF
jgi:hypothetical protein